MLDLLSDLGIREHLVSKSETLLQEISFVSLLMTIGFLELRVLGGKKDWPFLVDDLWEGPFAM